MTNMVAFLKKHPLAAYVALTFAISWGGMFILAGPGGLAASGELSESMLLYAYLAMLAGPAVAGVLLTALLDGRIGFRELGSRSRSWQSICVPCRATPDTTA